MHCGSGEGHCLVPARSLAASVGARRRSKERATQRPKLGAQTCKSQACCTAPSCCSSPAFPTPRCWVRTRARSEIKALIDRHGSVFVKPVFKGGVGKKGKAGLLGRAKDLKTALKEKERLYFVEHRHGNQYRQGERRDLRGRRAGRARGLFLDHRFDPLPRADDDAHASRRHGHRGARQEPRSPASRSIR